MKFFAVAAFALVLATTVSSQGVPAPVPEDAVDKRSPVAEAEPEPIPIADFELTKRACVASKCRCNKISGIFCGNTAINHNCPTSHVFQCNPSGATCDFGVRNSCAKCGRLSC